MPFSEPTSFVIYNSEGVEITGHNLIEEADVREYVSYIGGSYQMLEGPKVSEMTRKIANGAGTGWFDDGYGGMYDSYPGFSQGVPLRPHDSLLHDAMYAYWSRTDGIGYQYLADCYNKFARKDDERPLLPVPAHL